MAICGFFGLGVFKFCANIKERVEECGVTQDQSDRVLELVEQKSELRAELDVIRASITSYFGHAFWDVPSAAQDTISFLENYYEAIYYRRRVCECLYAHNHLSMDEYSARMKQVAHELIADITREVGDAAGRGLMGVDLRSRWKAEDPWLYLSQLR